MYTRLPAEEQSPHVTVTGAYRCEKFQHSAVDEEPPPARLNLFKTKADPRSFLYQLLPLLIATGIQDFASTSLLQKFTMASTSSSTPSESGENYLFKVTLRDIEDPQITRTLSCPADATFHKFHQAIIVSFGWALTHEYNFQVFNKPVPAGPGFWDARPIAEFSDFEPEDFPMIGIPNPPKAAWKESSKVRIDQYMAMPAYKNKRLQYEYDFGDGWEHAIMFIGRGPKTDKFVCIDGEGHGAAEDAGGPFGWQEIKEAYKTDSPDQRQKEKRWWYENFCTNGFIMGLSEDRAWRWDQEKINRQLARLPKLVWRHDRKLDVCKSSEG